MRVLITAGPTYEPIDPVRFIGNRSSGRMGSALAQAALSLRHQVALILGPVSVSLPRNIRRIDVETSRQMQEAVLREFPRHDLLIMAAAVSDFRPKSVHLDKLARGQAMTIECEPTEDIVAAAGRTKRHDQRIIGYSLEVAGDLHRAREKLSRKHLDLIVYNPTQTMNSPNVAATLLWRDGRIETLGAMDKPRFADLLLQRAQTLFER